MKTLLLPATLVALLSPSARATPNSSAALQDRSAVPTAEQVLQRLAPADTVAFVQFSSMQGCVEAWQMLETAFTGKPPETSFKDLLHELYADDAMFELIDERRPLALCVRLSKANQEPQVVLLAPTSDVSQFVQALNEKDPTELGDTKAFAANDSYAAVTLGSQAAYEAGKAVPAFLANLPEALLAARIDLKTVIEIFRPFIDGGLDMVESAAADAQSAGPVDTTEIVDTYLDLMREIVRCADRMEFLVTREGTNMRAEGAYVALEGSSLATYAKSGPTALPQLWSALDPRAPLAMLANYDMAKWYESMHGAWAGILDIYPEDLRPAMKQMIEEMPEFYGLMGPALAMSMGLGSEGLRMEYALKPTDGDRLLVKSRQIIESFGKGKMFPDGLNSAQISTVAGAEMWAFTGRMDVKALNFANAPISDADAQKLDSAMTQLFGKQGLQTTVVKKNALAGIVVGNSEDAQRFAERLGSAGAPADAAREFAAVANNTPSYFVQVELGGLLRSIRDIAVRMGETADLPPELPKDLGPAPFTSYGWAEGRFWRGGLALDARRVGPVFQVILAAQEIEQRQSTARYELGWISTELDRWAEAHDGKYPDTLDVLVKADENGESPLGLTTLPVDPWGSAYLYTPPTAGREPRVYTLGKDKQAGGVGEDADLDSAQHRAEMRTQKAQEQANEVRSALERFVKRNEGKHPASLDELVLPHGDNETDLGATRLPLDPWGRSYLYTAPTTDMPAARVFSLGRDGRVGGEGEDADVEGFDYGMGIDIDTEELVLPPVDAPR